MNETAKFLQLLESGHEISAIEAEQLAYALHAATVNMPEFLWMDRNFEELGDSIHRAIECYGAPQ